MNSPLEQAVNSDNIKIFELLRKSGADITKGDLVFQASWYSRDIKMLRHLLSLKLDINKKSKFGTTPLYNSLQDKSDYEKTKLLIENGAKVTDKEIKAAKPHKKSKKLLCNTVFPKKITKIKTTKDLNRSSCSACGFKAKAVGKGSFICTKE